MKSYFLFPLLSSFPSLTVCSSSLPPTQSSFHESYPDPSSEFSSSYWLHHELPGEHFPRNNTHNPDQNIVYEDLERIDNISREDFIEQYAQWGKPVIVTNSINEWDWDEARLWTAKGLRERFPGEVHSRYPRVGEEVS